jgi:hypothetical protein
VSARYDTLLPPSSRLLRTITQNRCVLTRTQPKPDHRWVLRSGFSRARGLPHRGLNTDCGVLASHGEVGNQRQPGPSPTGTAASHRQHRTDAGADAGDDRRSDRPERPLLVFGRRPFVGAIVRSSSASCATANTPPPPASAPGSISLPGITGLRRAPSPSGSAALRVRPCRRIPRLISRVGRWSAHPARARGGRWSARVVAPDRAA